MKKILKEKINPFLKLTIKHFQMGNVSDSAIVFAYYALLSLFPVLIIIAAAVKLINADPNQMLLFIKTMMPKSVFNVIEPIFNSTFSGNAGGGGNLSIGIIIAVWSASSAMAAFQRAVNHIYGVDSQSALLNRFVSFIWMMLLVLFLFALMLLMGFGKVLLQFIQHNFRVPKYIISTLEDARVPFILLLALITLVMLYYFVPSLKTKFKFVFTGAVFSVAGLSILAQIFSLIITNFFKNISAYKTLGTFIVVMLWLYFTGMILLIGAVLNASVHEYFLGNIAKNNNKIKKDLKKVIKA